MLSDSPKGDVGEMARELLRAKPPWTAKMEFALGWHSRSSFKDLREAYGKLDAADRDDPYTTIAYVSMSRVAGAGNAALPELERLLKAYPRNAYILYLAAMQRIRQKDLEGGRRDLLRAVELDPFHTPSLLALATYSEGEDPEKVQELIRRVLTVAAPGSTEAQEAMSLLEKLQKARSTTRPAEDQGK